MSIIEITAKDKSAYDRFVQNHPLGSIHQIWDWGVFQGSSGRRDKFWIFAAVDSQKHITASALVIRQKLPFGKCWLYCPRGPVGDYMNPEALKEIYQKLYDLARAENAVFLRFDPPLDLSLASHLQGLFGSIKAHPAHAHYQPESTLILDLKHAPEELLKRMKPKGRYNIKVAGKHGVKIRVSTPGTHTPGTHAPDPPSHPSPSHEADLKAFYALLRQTTERDNFSGHPLSYYKNMLEVLGPERAKLYLAEYDGKILAGMIATYFGETATYYFGASANEHRNTMAPYLLHWQAINDARAAGFHFYDFFGIAPEDSTFEVAPTSKVKPHPWAKVTEFKLKFGGERVNYLPAREIVYKPFWYALIKAAKWARGILRK